MNITTNNRSTRRLLNRQLRTQVVFNRHFTRLQLQSTRHLRILSRQKLVRPFLRRHQHRFRVRLRTRHQTSTRHLRLNILKPHRRLNTNKGPRRIVIPIRRISLLIPRQRMVILIGTLSQHRPSFQQLTATRFTTRHNNSSLVTRTRTRRQLTSTSNHLSRFHLSLRAKVLIVVRHTRQATRGRRSNSLHRIERVKLLFLNSIRRHKQRIRIIRIIRSTPQLLPQSILRSGRLQLHRGSVITSPAWALRAISSSFMFPTTPKQPHGRVYQIIYLTIYHVAQVHSAL